MRFTRKNRSMDQADFKFVFSSPHVSSDQYFRVLARANGREYCRLGMAVSRKVCRLAVGRNRLKRVIRENFRLQRFSRLAKSRGFDFVVLPKSQAASICNKTLNGSLLAHWQKAQGELMRAAYHRKIQ